MSFVRPLHLPLIPARNRGMGRAVAGETKWGRRVDVGGGIAVDVLSRNVSAWIPAFAGMTNSEGPELWLSTANWHGGFCHAPSRPLRGTCPSPREVFDRATFSHSAIGYRSTIRHVSPVESRHQG